MNKQELPIKMDTKSLKYALEMEYKRGRAEALKDVEKMIDDFEKEINNTFYYREKNQEDYLLNKLKIFKRELKQEQKTNE